MPFKFYWGNKMDSTFNKSSVSSNSRPTAEEHNMEDIKYLLQLEAMRRYSEDMKNIQRQVEDHARHWLDTKLEYLYLYNQLCELMKKVGLRHTLDTKLTPEAIEDTTDIVANVSTMRSVLTSDKRPVQVDELVLQETIRHLKINHQPRDRLEKQQRVFAENHETQKVIADMMENVKRLMETLIQQAMNQSVLELSPETVTRRQ